MTDHAELDLNTGARIIDRVRVEHGAKIVGFVAVAIAAVTLVLVMVAESRLTPEQRVAAFETSSLYP